MSQLKNIISIQQGTTPPPYTVLDHCYFNNSPVSLGFKLTNTTTLLKISLTAKNSNWIFGARDYQTSSERFTLQASTGEGVITNNISASTTTNISDLTKRIDYSYNGSTITILNNDNTYTSTNTRGFPNGSRNLVIGGIRNGASIVSSNLLNGYFWNLQIEDNNVLTHNIIPVKDENNVICIYDIITDVYLYPASGTLLENEPLSLNMINPNNLQLNVNEEEDENI